MRLQSNYYGILYLRDDGNMDNEKHELWVARKFPSIVSLIRNSNIINHG